MKVLYSDALSVVHALPRWKAVREQRPGASAVVVRDRSRLHI